MKLELRGVARAFGLLATNGRIDLTVEPGQIHALLGENDTGRSTLINALYSLHQLDVGEILVDNESITFPGPGDAITANISIVHQHFTLVPIFIVAGPIALGYKLVGSLEPLDTGAATTKATEIPRHFDLDVDPHALIEDLSVGVQQHMEIIRVLARDAKVLILDELIAVLIPQETDGLITIIRELKTSGISTVLIAYKLHEIHEVTDIITVIHRGRAVSTAEPAVSVVELIDLMVDHNVSLTIDESLADSGDDELAPEDINLIEDGATLLENIDLHVHTDGILATTGVQGSDQTELSEVILELHPPTTGSVTSDSQDVIRHAMCHRLRAGLGLMPEDHTTSETVAELSITENMVLDRYNDPSLRRDPSLSPAHVRHATHRMCEEFDVCVTDVDDAIFILPGGNQQKVIFARELSRPLKVLIVFQSTHSLDVGSIEFVHQHIVAKWDAGTAVLVISSKLDEVYTLAGRIVVMYRGRIVGTVPANATRDTLGLVMAGTPTEQTLDPQKQT